MTMVPEAWQNDPLMQDHTKDFYRWSACTLEPWDGPALVIARTIYQNKFNVFLLVL